MGNATAVRSFALSGGAAGSMLGAVLVVLGVLGAILAFNADDRTPAGTTGQTISIQGAPEAAAQSVAPATRAVARTPAPVPEPVASGAPATRFASPAPAPAIETSPPADLPAIAEPDNPPVPDPPRVRECVAGERPAPMRGSPDLPTAGGLLGNVSGGVDSTTTELLGIDLGLQALTAPLGQFLDDPLGKGLQPSSKRRPTASSAASTRR